jgi:hypothetical protein
MNRLLLYLINFLPIFIIFLLVFYTNTFAIISNTILGKLFAVLLILFYVKHDKYIGLFICLLIIFYYQNDYITYFDWLNKPTAYLKTTTKLSPKEIDPIFENMKNISDSNGLDIKDAYSLSIYKEENSNTNQKKDIFRKKYCKKGHLIHKGQSIHNEMSGHIFPEIKHNDEHHKCNLCDNTCDFSFVEKKINMEDLLVKPKSSNDWVVYVWENMMNLTE